MPDIRVTCPTCKTQLEIDSAHEGEEVECGNCLQVFVASTKKPKDADPDKKAESGGGKIKGATSKTRASRDRDDDDDDDDRDRGRSRRRDDDDDDDDDDYEPRRRRKSGGSNGLAITSLVLGITAFFPGCCCYLWIPLSLGAIITGALGMKNENGKGMAIAGLVLGICALALFSLLLIIGFGMQAGNPGRFR